MNKTINLSIKSQIISQSETHGKTFVRVNIHYANGIKLQITTYNNGKISVKVNRQYKFDQKTGNLIII